MGLTMDKLRAWVTATFLLTLSGCSGAGFVKDANLNAPPNTGFVTCPTMKSASPRRKPLADRDCGKQSLRLCKRGLAEAAFVVLCGVIRPKATCGWPGLRRY